jgi:hypothetical protein
MATKRLIAEVPDDFFWDVKKKLAEVQLNQKTATAVAVRELIHSDYPLAQLVEDPEDLKKLNDMGIK